MSNACAKMDKMATHHGKNLAAGHSKTNHGIQATLILLTAKDSFQYLTEISVGPIDIRYVTYNIVMFIL